MAKKEKDNFLNYIPRHNVLYPSRINREGHVEVRAENKGPFKKLTQLLLKKPRYSYIELDTFGSFVWKQMDGKKDIYAIGLAVHEKFGANAEPLYPRLSTYIKTLHGQHFVVYENKLKR